MKTTLEMPDDVYRRAKAVAALRGMSIKQFITQSVQAALHAPSTMPGAGEGAAAAAVAFARELDVLGAEISASWRGPQDAVAAIRDQRAEVATGTSGHEKRNGRRR